MIGIAPQDVTGPLQHFQSVRADREGTKSLICALNAVLKERGEPSQSDADLETLFQLCWPEFERALNEAPKVPLDAGPERSTTEILGELLSIARMHSRFLASMLRAAPQYTQPIERATPRVHTAASVDLKRLDFEDARRDALDLRSAGRHAEAIEAFKRALEIAPNDVETLIDVAVTETYIDPSNYQRSIEQLTALVNPGTGENGDRVPIDSIVAKAYYNLACLKTIAREEQAGRYELREILRDLESALACYPLYVNTARADQDLVSLRGLGEFEDLMSRYLKAQR
jgi:tetratricopeptide (TPR) repeat protein